jgi:DNA-binding MarR family transcriptional regulator
MISDDLLGQKIAGIAPMLIEHMAAQLRQLDHIIAPAHLRILARLKQRSQTVSELARMHKVSVPSMSNTVQTLVIRGWIERTPMLEDRRRVQLKLTEEGLAATDKLQNLVTLAVAEAISVLGEEDRARLWGGLEVLCAVFDPDQDRVDPA